MLYYRQKMLLALIEEFGGNLGRSDLQKYLFILSEKQDDKDRKYFFLPYKYGCFSFQSYKDLQYLNDNGYLENSNDWVLSSTGKGYKSQLTLKDKDILEKLNQEYKNIAGDKLIRQVYLSHPYYTIKSEIVNRILTEEEIQIISNVINLKFKREENHKLFTIGYEGLSIEEYINKLIVNNIKTLCDVRKNPLSRKYGFSKSQLLDITGKFDIEYIHIPQIGIESSERKELKTKQDYINLFDNYRKTVLKNQNHILNYLYDIFKKKKRLALTCFEEKAEFCHRTQIANYLTSKADWKYEFEEL